MADVRAEEQNREEFLVMCRDFLSVPEAFRETRIGALSGFLSQQEPYDNRRVRAGEMYDRGEGQLVLDFIHKYLTYVD